MKGKPVNEGMALEGFNTKLQPQTKQMIVALTAVKKMAGHRELIEDMLKVYKDRYPQDWHKAACMVALLNGEEPPEAPPIAAAAEPVSAEPLQHKPAAPKQMAVYTCKLEDGRQAIIATTSRSKAAQLLGVIYRYFMANGDEYLGDDRIARSQAMKNPGQPYVRLVDDSGMTTGWEPIIRTAKTYIG